MSWFEERFAESASRLRFDCIGCGRGMWFPKSKHGKYKTCSRGCAETARAQAKDDRRRACETCGAQFIPRPAQLQCGHGRFCSQACNVAGRAALLTKSSKEKAAMALATMRAAGLISPAKGAASASWKGGREAAKARHARTRAEYKRANKDKVAAWAANRRKVGAGKLPTHTIAELMVLQRGRCAACSAHLKKTGRHLDHIVALSRGGTNTRRNVQLLCPLCNTRKAAKDPIKFMQEMGFLL